MAPFAFQATDISGASEARNAVLAGDLERLLDEKERQSTLRRGLRTPLLRPVYPTGVPTPAGRSATP